MERCMGFHTSILEKAKRALCGDTRYLDIKGELLDECVPYCFYQHGPVNASVPP